MLHMDVTIGEAIRLSLMEWSQGQNLREAIANEYLYMFVVHSSSTMPAPAIRIIRPVRKRNWNNLSLWAFGLLTAAQLGIMAVLNSPSLAQSSDGVSATGESCEEGLGNHGRVVEGGHDGGGAGKKHGHLCFTDLKEPRCACCVVGQAKSSWTCLAAPGRSTTAFSLPSPPTMLSATFRSTHALGHGRTVTTYACRAKRPLLGTGRGPILASAATGTTKAKVVPMTVTACEAQLERAAKSTSTWPSFLRDKSCPALLSLSRSPLLHPTSSRYGNAHLMSSALSTFSQSTAIASPTINIMTKIGSFSLVTKVNTSFDIPITKYRSQATGLEVTFVDVDTPIVNGLAAIATEEANELIDGGRPHTLEHLIFLGSEDFPYKGVLDTLANRARARGTNAWTAQDSTVYTITTAGANGFAKILPIYLDHVLYPTMTDAGFVTEVYHVNGEGQDGGVVYSEMQGRENGPGDLTWHRMGQLMYPAPSGYASETGGLMRKLRELTIDEIRKYHARYYRPDNLCLIVTGKVDHAKLLDRLEQTEAKIKSKGELPKVDRPWVNSPIAPLTKSVSEVVPFPDEDESKGNLVIAFRGPPVTNAIDSAKLDALLTYLTDSSVSLLQSKFVECEDPVATSVSDYTNNYKETSSVLYFSSVPTDKLGDLEHKVQEVLAAHTIDIERMHTVLEQRRLRIQNGVESDPGMAMAHSIITHFLYGDRETAKDLIDFVDEEHIFKHLTAMTKDQWQELLQTKLVNAPRIALQAKPSAQLAKDLAAQEAARVAERQKNPEQLKKYQETLDAAMKANDMPIPPEVISNFEVPPMDANLPNVLTAQLPAGRFQNELQAKLDALPATAKLPFFVQLDQVQSQFIGSRLAIDTTHLSGDLRKYLGVYLELVFASPVTLADGSKLTHEQVVAGLNQDTIHFNAGCGAVGESSGSSFSGGAFESQISLWIRSTPEKYAKAVQWIHTVVKHLEFDYGRLATVIRNMLGNVPALKREAMRMASWAIKSTVYDAATSNHAALALNNQVPFLKQLLERVEAKDARVVEDLKALSAALFKPANVRLHLSGAVAKVGVQPALEAWQGIVAAKDGQVAVSVPAKPTREFLNAVGQNPNSKNGRGKLINIPSNESGYLVTLTRGPASNEHPDYPAVMVAFEVLQALEGPLWKNIRGPGLAYGANLSVDPTSSLLTFNIYRGANVVEAFRRARDIVTDLATKGVDALDKDFFDAAKASLAYNVVSREETPRDAATQSFIANSLHHTTMTRYNAWLLEQIDKVSMADVVRVAKQYMPNMFSPDTALFVGVTGPSKVDETVKGFEALGVKLEVTKVDE